MHSSLRKSHSVWLWDLQALSRIPCFFPAENCFLIWMGSSILFLTFFSNKWALYLFCYLNKRGTRCFGDFSLDRDGWTGLKQDLNKCLPQQRGEAEDLRPQSSEGPLSQLGWPPSSGGSACSCCECLCSPVHVLTVRSCVCTRQEQGHWKELELNPCQ